MTEEKNVGADVSEKVSDKGTDQKTSEGRTEVDVKALIAEAIEQERRGWQSAADRRIAAAEKEAADARRDAEGAKARELALISDPELREKAASKYAREEMERQLASYKRDAEMSKGIASWVGQGVDPKIFEGAASPRDIYERGLKAVLDENAALKAKTKNKVGDDEVKKLKESGALQVSTSGGPAPLITSQTELEKKRAEARARARDPKLSKKDRTAARMESLKLAAVRATKKG